MRFIDTFVFKKSRFAAMPSDSFHIPWRNFFRAFWPLIIIFCILRLVGIMNQPVWNDEPLYIQYMQIMNKDLLNNLWISTRIVEWKPPLQYWVGSFFINIAEDPVKSARFMGAVVSIIGFLFSLKLCREISGSAGFTQIFGLLVMVNPFYLMFDKTALTDVWVYSFGSVYFYFLYRLFAGYVTGNLRGAALYAVVVLFLGTGLMLIKQSAELFPLYALMLAAVIKLKQPETTMKQVAVMLVIGVGLFFAARLLYVHTFPPQVYEWKYTAPENAEKTFSPEEMVGFPWQSWVENVGVAFWKSPLNSFGAWSYMALVFMLAYCLLFVKESRKTVLYCLAAVLFVNLPLIMILKAPWIKFFAVNCLFTMVILFSAAIYFSANDISGRFAVKTAWLVPAVLTLVAIPTELLNARDLVFGEYREARVIGDFQGLKACMMNGDCEWWTPMNLPRSLEYLEAESRKGEKGILFIDPQWGHPANYLLIYQYRFPNISIEGGVHPNMFRLMDEVVNTAYEKMGAKNVYLIFNGLRYPWGREFLFNGNCPHLVVIDQHSSRSNILICRFGCFS